MTVLYHDGFETYGDLTTSDANLNTRITETYGSFEGVVQQFITTGPLPNGVSLIDDFATEGFALEFDDTGSTSAKGEIIDIKAPKVLNVLTTASSTVFQCGFRHYNGELDAVTTVPDRWIWHNTQGTWATTGAGSRQTRIVIEDDGTTLHVRLPAGGTSTYTNAVSVNTWHYIEVEWKAAKAVDGGYIKVWVDGTLIHDVGTEDVSTASFFRTLGFTYGSQISGGNNDGTNSTPSAMDDMYFIHVDGVTHVAGTPLGDSRVIKLSPTSDAVPNDWTPDSGVTNYTQVDEQDWVTTDYVDATTTGDDDHYGLATLAATTIHNLQVNSVVVAVDGTPTLHLGFDDGTDDSISMGIIATGTDVQMTEAFPLDPSGSAWTNTSVNAVEATQRMTE
jgi:hypothetical protein